MSQAFFVYLFRPNFEVGSGCVPHDLPASPGPGKHAGKPRRDAWSQKCSCPLWVQGSLAGEYLRRSLDLVSWEAAQDRVRGWEASGEIGVIKTDIPDVPAAVERFFEDATSRGLAEATIGKQNVLLRKQFLPWCKTRGFHSLKQIGVDEITQFRVSWTDSPISKYKKQERLKGFFHFCVAREWTRMNPVAALKPIKVPPSQTLPFDGGKWRPFLKPVIGTRPKAFTASRTVRGCEPSRC